MFEAHRDAMRRHASGQLGAITSQRQGVHNFFEQENQPQKPGSGTWPSNEQSPYFLPRAASAEPTRRPFHMSNTYEPTSHGDHSERSSLEARMTCQPVGFTKQMVRDAMDNTNLLNISSAMQNEARNHIMNAQRFSNLSHNNQLKPSYSTPFNNGMPSHHSTMESMGYFGAQYQSQVDKHDAPNHDGIAVNNASIYDFLGNQVPWRGPLQHSQAETSQQFEGSRRTTGFTELQSQQQLQEMFLAHQLKQLEDSKQQQMLQQAHDQFSRTSYSELLHGPDTPPSQHQTTGVAIEEYEIQAAGLDLQNTEPLGWSVGGPSYYQGFANDLGTEQNQNLASQLSLFGEALDSGCHSGNLGDHTGSALASYSGVQNTMPEYLGGGQRSPSMQQIEKPMLQPCRPGSEHLTENQTCNFGLGNDWNRTNQPHANLSAVQNPQHQAESLLRQKVKGNGLSQVNAFSQSQQHFQELQLNEQRSSSIEQKQPSQNSNLLPQNSLSSAKSMPKNGMQQGLNSFNTNNVMGCSPYHLANTPLDGAASFESPQWLTSSSTGTPSRHTIVGDVGGQHQSSPWDSMQALQKHKGTGFRTWPISNAKNSTLGNSSAQQGAQQVSPMLGVSPGSVKTSAIRQQGLYNVQDSSVNLRVPTAGSGVISNQVNSKALQDCRMEIKEANGSDSTFQPSSEPASQFQGAWKKCTPSNQFVAGVGPLGQPLDGLRPSHGFKQQGSLNSEASAHTMAMPTNPNVASVQYVPRQHVREEQLPVKDGQRLQRHISQGETGSLPTANFMKTLSKQAGKVVPDVVEEVQGLLYQSAEPQDTFLEKQREVPQQQVDSCTASISLAHLRGSQSSNSLSPQHVNLGLGPSHDSQQVNDANWRSFPHIQSLDGEVPTMKSAHKNFYAGSPSGTSASEMTTKNEVEGNQGKSATGKRMVLQSSATPPSVFTSRSSPVLKETTLSDALPSSSFASGHGMSANAVFPANAIPHSHEYNAAGEPSQTEYRMGGNLSGVSQVQTSALNHNSHQDSLNGYVGKSSSISNYSREPNHSVGAMLMQNQHLNDSLRQSNNDGGGMHVMKDHNSSNMALKQFGNRAQAVNLAGMATSPKLEQSKCIGSHGQDFSGIVESSQLPSSSAREVGVGPQRDAIQPMQRTQLMWRNPANRGGEEYSVQTSSIGRQSPLNECENQFNATPSGNEVSGSVSNTLHPNLQEGRLSLSPMNGGLSSSLQGGGLSQDPNNYHHTKSLNAFTPETDGVAKSSSRPPLKPPSCFVQGHPVQHMNHQGMQRRQTSEGIESNAGAKRLSESARLPSPQKSKFPLQSGSNSPEPQYVGKWTVNQQAQDPRSTGDRILRLKALQQHNAVQNNPQPADMLSLGHSQLPKQLDNVASFTSTKKDNCLALNTDDKLIQTVSYPANPNHQSFYYFGSKHAKAQATGNPSTLLQQSFGNKEVQFVSNNAQGSKSPLGLESSVLKEEGDRTPTQGQVSMQNHEHQLSSSKVINHDIGTLHSKKRKKQLPLLIPWHIGAAQPSIDLPSISNTELMWASAANRRPEKVTNTSHEENTLSISRAKRRLILTTESMQQLFPPLPDGLMHGNTPADNECALYSLAKLALEDTCRLVSKTNGQASLAQTSSATANMASQRQAWGMAENNALAKCVESFMERVKQLGMELARLDCSTSASELQGKRSEEHT
eukprot:c14879_g1_i1 orf=2-5038(-)